MRLELPRSIALFLAAWLVLGVLPLACQKPVRVKNGQVGTLAALFKDTTILNVSPRDRRTFDLQKPGQRDSLHAALKRERGLWRSMMPSGYRFLLRTQCFCPGGRGWLVMEVREGQPLRAWDRAAKAVPLQDWDTFSIDGLFDNLERSAEHDRVVQVAFDPHWHVPAFVHTIARMEPDTWGTFEVRGLRPW